MKESKKEIRERLPIYIDLYNFEGDTKKVIEYIESIPIKVKDWIEMSNTNLSNVSYPILEKEKVQEYQDKLLSCFRYEINISKSYEDIELEVYGIRLETDEEFQDRINKVKGASNNARKAALTKKKNQELKDKEEYLRLKKKFEK